MSPTFEVSDVTGAQSYADYMILLNDGQPEVIPADATATTEAIEGRAAVVALDFLPAGTLSFQLAQQLLDLKEAALAFIAARDSPPTERLSADTLAEALARATDPTGSATRESVRARNLPAIETSAIMSRAEGRGMAKFETGAEMPGTRAISLAAHWTSHSARNPETANRAPQFPTYADLPFDETLAEDRTKICGSAPTTHDYILAATAHAGALEACAQEVELPTGYVRLFTLDAAEKLSGRTLTLVDPTGVHKGYNDFRLAMKQDLKGLDPAYCLGKLKSLFTEMARHSQGHGWEVKMYPQAIDYLTQIRRNAPIATTAAAPTAAAPAAAAATLATTSATDAERLKRKQTHEAKMAEQKRAKEAKLAAQASARGGGGRGYGGNPPYHQYPPQGQYGHAYPQNQPPRFPPGPGGVPACNDFRRGKCTRGASCKFTH